MAHPEPLKAQELAELLKDLGNVGEARIESMDLPTEMFAR